MKKKTTAKKSAAKGPGSEAPHRKSARSLGHAMLGSDIGKAAMLGAGAALGSRLISSIFDSPRGIRIEIVSPQTSERVSLKLHGIAIEIKPAETAETKPEE